MSGHRISGSEINDDWVKRRLDQIQETLERLVGQRIMKDFYSIRDVAELLDKDDFTVREWCRLGRIHARKKLSGRGRAREWAISNDELNRYRREGLLPPQKKNDLAGYEAG